MLRHLYELAHKEIAALIVADEHPNIVRCHALEEDTEFIYLALERCGRPLADITDDKASMRTPCLPNADITLSGC